MCQLAIAADAPAPRQPAAEREWRSVDPARQGYPRNQSVAMLDPEVRQFLDGILRLYKEEDLFADRAKALQLLGVTHTTRRWSNERTLPGRYRHYFDSLDSGGVFARPGWTGEYAYRSHGADPETWHARISITIDAAKDCQNSRAVEGYLDLQLDPGIRQQVHPVPERLFRHEVDFAEPYAPPISHRTPVLILTISKGCMVGFQLARIFSFKEVSDARSHDQ
jgi:hypothetical protein